LLRERGMRKPIHSLAGLVLLSLVGALGACSDEPSQIDASTSPDLGGPDVTAVLAARWQVLPNAPKISGKQDDLFFIDEQEGWSVNGEGRIFHTTDGGATWDKLIDWPGTYFRAVIFLDAQRGFAGNIGTGYFPDVTDDRPLFSTSDGGKTWNEVTAITGPKPVGICNFTAVDSQHLFATGRVGGPSFLLRSADAGATWTSIDLSAQIGMLIDGHFSSPTEGVLVGGSTTGSSAYPIVLRTTDGGDSFTEVFASDSVGAMAWKLSFPSALVGYASVQHFSDSPGSFLKTTDGGASWMELPITDQPFSGLGIGFLTDQIGWVGGGAASRPGYRTVDGGMSWMGDDSLGARVNRFRFVADGKIGYAIGSAIQKLTL